MHPFAFVCYHCNKLQSIFKKDLNAPIKSIAKDKVDQAFIEKAEEICDVSKM